MYKPYKIGLLLCVLFCFLSIGNTQNTNESWGSLSIADFSGGVNSRDGSGGIADNEITESINCYVDHKIIMKRLGYSRYNDSTRVAATSVGTGVKFATFTGGDQIVATAGSVIAKKGANTWTPITGSVTLTANKLVMFAMVNNVLIGTNATNPAWYYTGSDSCATLSGENIPTVPTACENFHGRLILAQGRRLYWSGYLGDWDKFHPDDYQDFEENITALKTIGENTQSVLLIFTQRSVTACYFDADIGSVVGGRGIFRFEGVSNRQGCIAPLSVQECLMQDGSATVIFADYDGLKAFYGGQIVKLTDKIQPDWNNLEPKRLDDATGLNYKPKRWYLFSCTTSGGTTNDRVIIFDLLNWTITGYFDWTINTFTTIVASGVESIIGSDYSGYWNTYDDTYNDNGAAISARFVTKAYDGGEPFTDKGFAGINFLHEYYGTYNLGYTIFYDFSTRVLTGAYTPSSHGLGGLLGSFVLGTDRVGLATGTIIAGKEITGHGRLAQIRIENAGVSERFAIYRLSLLYKRSNMVIIR